MTTPDNPSKFIPKDAADHSKDAMDRLISILPYPSIPQQFFHVHKSRSSGKSIPNYQNIPRAFNLLKYKSYYYTVNGDLVKCPFCGSTAKRTREIPLLAFLTDYPAIKKSFLQQYVQDEAYVQQCICCHRIVNVFKLRVGVSPFSPFSVQSEKKRFTNELQYDPEEIIENKYKEAEVFGVFLDNTSDRFQYKSWNTVFKRKYNEEIDDNELKQSVYCSMNCETYHTDIKKLLKDALRHYTRFIQKSPIKMPNSKLIKIILDYFEKNYPVK